MREKITIIAPMYNESDLVERYCSETMKALNKLSDAYYYEIVLVNDGSVDDTLTKMCAFQEKYPDKIGIINLTRNFGLEGAIHAGIQSVQEGVTVVMDADLQDPPSVIVEMLEEYEKGADVVVANRKKREHDSHFKRKSASLYYSLLDRLSGELKLEHGAANFRLLSNQARIHLMSMGEVTKVFRVMVPYVGMKTSVVEYNRDRRYAGDTKYNLRSMIEYSLNSITGISVKPLKWLSFFNIVPATFIVGSICGMIMATGYYRFFFAIGLCISVMSICVTLMMSVIAEYLSQVMLEVKARPDSIIYEHIPAKEVYDELC